MVSAKNGAGRQLIIGTPSKPDRQYPDPYALKMCWTCLTEKPVTDFQMRTERATPRSKCKKCDAQRRRELAELTGPPLLRDSKERKERQ